MTELPQSRLATSLHRWGLQQPIDPLERIVIVVLSNAVLFWAVKALPAREVTGMMTGAMLVNLLLLIHVTLRSPVGPLQRTPLELSMLPLSLLLLCGTVALAAPIRIRDAIGLARYQALPPYTGVAFQLQNGQTVKVQVRAHGLTCLLRRDEVTISTDAGRQPAPRVYLRLGQHDLTVTGVAVPATVRAAIRKLPLSTVNRLSCQSPHAKRTDDLQTWRRNNVLTIDASMR